MMNLDNGLWILALLAEAALVGLLIYRRAWKLIPVFLVFCAFEVCSSTGAYLILHQFPDDYPVYYLIESVIDSILEFAVLVELAWLVLRPIRGSLSPKTPLVIAIILLVLGAAIWPFSSIQSLVGFAPAVRAIAHVQQTTSILRVLFFVGLAVFSQFLSIGWRDRELQIATGLGFYSLVSLGTAMLHTHPSTWIQYNHLNQLVLASFICSLTYWVFCFSQKEAERREFTPQMQNLLLAVAGVARAERSALHRMAGSDPQSKKKKQ